MGKTVTINNGINRAKWWQIAGLALNEIATNIYMWQMLFISYYLNGIVGVGVVVASTFATAMRLWDGVTDPIIGMILDKTNGRFGKNRPFLIIGQVIMIVMSAIMFFVTPRFPKGLQFIAFIVFYAIYIIGYTCQCVVTKSAQSCLTNDQKQRPTFGIYQGIINTIFFAVAPMYSYTYLLKKHNFQFNMAYFQEQWLVTVVISAVVTVLVFFAISGKDKPEYYGLGEKSLQEPLKLRDYWEVLKHNKPLQMLVIVASTDKLATQTKGNATVSIIIYGIICGNAAAAGLIGAYTTIPGILILLFGIGFVARRMGQKKGIQVGSWGGIITLVLLIMLFIFGDPTTLSFPGDGVFTGWTSFSVLYIALSICLAGFSGITNGLVYPMTADCVDYEVYRSGRYVPGMIGTLFSFVDKLISSLAPTVVGLLCAIVGFREKLPTADTPYSSSLAAVGIFSMFGIVLIGYICNIVALKFYTLNREKMDDIQNEIARIKMEA